MQKKVNKKPNRGRPRKDEGRDIKESILSAAVELFSQKGFRKVTIGEITELAGGTVGLARHYFGSKDDLIGAANTHVIGELRSIFTTIAKHMNSDDGDILMDQLLDGIMQFLVPRVSLLFYLRQLVAEDPKAANAAFEAYFQLLQVFFSRLEATGSLAPEVNKTWLTFELMFIQIGPVFLSEQIEFIVGRPAYEEQMVTARAKEAARLIRSALKSRSKP